MNTALLLSGGIGSRISAEVPKQYLRIRGRMLITYALEPLLVSPHIDAVKIVAEQRWRDAILRDARLAGLPIGKISGFAIPGANRQSSILNGLEDILLRNKENTANKGRKSVKETRNTEGTESPERTESPEGTGSPEETESPERTGNLEGTESNGKTNSPENAGSTEATDTVLIHDAARPLLGTALIEACFLALNGHDGVMPVLPMKDTVYLSKDGRQVDGLFKRSQIFSGQAPELFLLQKYYHANIALLPDRIMEINGSTEPAVMAGLDIVMIPGEERNFKVTTEADLQRFRSYMEQKTALSDELWKK